MSSSGTSARHSSQRTNSLCKASTLVPESVLSVEELEVLRLKFAKCNSIKHPTRPLSTAQAVRLFRDDYPALSEMEVLDMFHQCDLNHDGHLALSEYLQTRAFYRLRQEVQTEHELLRCFSILDTDNDGLLRASEVQHLFAQSGQAVVAVIAQAIGEAAMETQNRCELNSRRRGQSPQRKHSSRQMRSTSKYSNGEITFESFAHTIRGINRKMEQEIAAKTLRVIHLEDLLDLYGVPVTRSSSPTMKRSQPNQHSPLKPRGDIPKVAIGLQIELDVLTKEILRIRSELISGVHDSMLGQICEALVASYANEQHVYECLSNLIDYCGLRDPASLRHKLEQSGREVNVLDRVLLAPPEAVQGTSEFSVMMNLLHPSGNAQPTLVRPLRGVNFRTSSNEERSAMGSLLANITLRKQFAFYAMAGNPMNFITISRSGFLRFAKDCKLHLLRSPSLTDAELYRMFALAAGPGKHMTYCQWLRACELLVVHSSVPCDGESPSEDMMVQWVHHHVIANAKTIPSQPLAPDISQTHVTKLMRERMWTFKQIFCHFGNHSLTELDNTATLKLKEFLELARIFGLVRASVDRDGEPFTPPPACPSKGTLEPISFTQLMREYYIAKLDVSMSNWRESTDLTFREFLRCIERVAVAMHAHKPQKTVAHANGVISTSFQAVKDDDYRPVERTQTPLYHRRGNLFGAAASPTKNCKMTSTSIISTLLKSSREMITVPLRPGIIPRHGSQPPTNIVYGRNNQHSRPQPESLTPRAPNTPRTPQSPLTNHERVVISPRVRPVTSGGASVIQVIRPPTTHI